MSMSLKGFISDSGDGCNLLGKGYNQGYNQNIRVTTTNGAFLDQRLQPNDDIYLSRAEVQNLLDITQQAINKAIKKGRFRAILVNGNGGMQYRIALTSLPEPAQIAWVQANPEQAIFLPQDILDRLSPKAQWEVIKLKTPKEEVGVKALEKANEVDRDIELINKALHVPKGWKRSKWIEQVAKEAGITKQALYKKIRKYKEKGITGLRHRENHHLKKWDPEALQFLQGVYLKLIKEGGSGTKKRAYEATVAEAEKRGWSIGNASSAYTYLSQLNPLVKRYAEAGTRGLDNVFYIVRKYDDLEPLECIVGDQHRFDFFVEDKETGKVFRPEGYFWIDLRTRLCYGFSLADRYNSYMMGLALRMGLKSYGKFKTCYTDNGKPEVSKYFSSVIKELHLYGMDEKDISELYKTDSGYVIESQEGEAVEIVETRQAWHRYARPYNAKAKPIERFFNSIEKILLDLGTPGLVRELRGTNEEKAQDDKRLKQLREEGKLLSFEEFMVRVFQAVEIYNNRKHYALKSSPIETFLNCIKEGFVPRMIVERELDFILLKREQRSVNRGRVLINGVLYEGESLEEGLWDVPDKTKIEVRYDPYEMDKVYAIRPDGRIVELREVPVSSMKDKEKTSELMARKREMIRQIKEEYKKLTSKVKGVIQYSSRTKEVMRQKKKYKPEAEIIDREAFEREVQRKIELTREINSQGGFVQRELKKPGFFASEREKYQYLVDCEMEGIGITEEDRRFMKRYEDKMEPTERMWWDNYRRLYHIERRVRLC